MIKICNISGRILYSGDFESDKACLEDAVKNNVDLYGVNLYKADLRGADLRGAKGVFLNEERNSQHKGKG